MDDVNAKNPGGVTFSEGHAITTADVDGDGIADIIAGKRLFSHLDSYTDPDPHGDAALYVFRSVRDKRAPGGATFVPQLVHGKERCAHEMRHDLQVLIVGVTALLSVRVTHAQIAETYALPRPASCCLLNTATTLAEQLQDWNQLGRYHEANQELMKQPVDPGRVVFMGDSITDGYRLDEAFPGKPYVNRGISGQTTAQMLVRFYPDVLALKPAAVVIFAGTNDIARNNGPQTFEMIQHNIMAMTELAQGHGVKVILCALMPISDRTIIPAGGRGGGPTPRPRIQSVQRPPADLLKFNAWLKRYAAEKGAVYADYYTATVDAEGFLRDGYTNDGLHPNAQGYMLMTPVVSAAIADALRR